MGGTGRIIGGANDGYEQLQIQGIPDAVCEGIRGDLLPDDGVRDEGAEADDRCDGCGVESKDDKQLGGPNDERGKEMDG